MAGAVCGGREGRWHVPMDLHCANFALCECEREKLRYQNFSKSDRGRLRVARGKDLRRNKRFAAHRHDICWRK